MSKPYRKPDVQHKGPAKTTSSFCRPGYRRNGYPRMKSKREQENAGRHLKARSFMRIGAWEEGWPGIPEGETGNIYCALRYSVYVSCMTGGRLQGSPVDGHKLSGG
jgi:hypothetical protein